MSNGRTILCYKATLTNLIYNTFVLSCDYVIKSWDNLSYLSTDSLYVLISLNDRVSILLDDVAVCVVRRYTGLLATPDRMSSIA